MQQLLKIHTSTQKKRESMSPFRKTSPLPARRVAEPGAAAQPAGGAPASEEPSAREATDRRIARLDEAIRQVELTRNRLMWNTYLDYAEQGRITPDVMDYPGLDYERLRDTVPAIDTLGCRYTAAAEAYTQVLRTDPEYEAIHQEYVSLKGVSDRDRQAENRMRYNLLYDRLRRNNPDYVPAWERMNEAKRQRNMAVLRYLVESHAAAGRVLPTDPLFRKISMVYTMLRNRCPEIARLDVELDAPRRLLDGIADERFLLVFGHGGGLARRAEHDESMRPARDLVFHHLAERFEIDAVPVERGDHRRCRPSQKPGHGNLPIFRLKRRSQSKYPFAAGSSASSTAPPAAPRSVLWESPTKR